MPGLPRVPSSENIMLNDKGQIEGSVLGDAAMIRKILVPVRGDGKGDNVLAHAAALAHRNKSHIEVAHCRVRPQDLMPSGVPLPSMLRKQLARQAEELANFEEASLKDELKALAEKLGLALDRRAATAHGPPSPGSRSRARWST